MFKHIIALLLIATLAVSCSTRKKMVYFQTAGADSTAAAPTNYTPIFKTDDFLSIVVTAEDPETAIPFNFPSGGVREPINFGYTIGTPVRTGYLVDSEGNIDLPIIGKNKVAGLSRPEVNTILQEKYKEYLKHPVINIQIQNFKVTVLGEVARPGTFQIPNERITLLEAIGLSGDLRITGERNNVLVIRDRNGEKTEYRVDLTTKEVLSSPVYYLEQNDVVYVEPNSASRSQGTLWRSAGPLFISLTSLVITTIVLIAR
jgi:polysaccharide biosynthesis/export protein